MLHSIDQRNPWDQSAQLYEDVRPSYPDRLIDDLVRGVNLSAEDRLLEIGAGTGKATVQLAERGFSIHCIEPGPNLAGILAAKCAGYPNVSIDIASFEEWTPGDDASFDLILCAQAFNWLDPEVRYGKCHQLLNDGGHLALFWYGDCTGMDWEAEIAASRLFQGPQVFDYHSEWHTDAETSIKATESTSAFAALDEAAKSKLREDTRRRVESQGGLVTTSLDYKMYLTRKL